MCLPAAPLALAAGITSAIGTGISALQARAQARYQAKIADRNARLESEAAFQAQEATRQSALDHYRQSAQARGTRLAAMAANGIDANFGSALWTNEDADLLTGEGIRNIYDQGLSRVRGHDIAMTNYRGQAQASRQAGTAALMGGLFSGASSVLGGVKQYRQLKG